MTTWGSQQCREHQIPPEPALYLFTVSLDSCQCKKINFETFYQTNACEEWCKGVNEAASHFNHELPDVITVVFVYELRYFRDRKKKINLALRLYFSHISTRVLRASAKALVQIAISTPVTSSYGAHDCFANMCDRFKRGRFLHGVWLENTKIKNWNMHIYIVKLFSKT